MIKTYYLYSRNARKKVITSIIETDIQDEGFVIRKKTGQLDGKLTIQPEKVIDKGKAKRTINEQLELEVNSIINRLKDKGYLALDQIVDNEVIDKIDPMDYNFIDSLLSQIKKDANGNSPPMLAQDAHKRKKNGDLVKDPTWFERAWWTSMKIDGVRTKGKVKQDADGNNYIEFLSRTGKPYTASVRGWDRDPQLIQFMLDHDCEIDGEIYTHGYHLNVLSGDARKQTYVPERHDKLEFWVFDIAKDEMDATARVKILNELVFENPKIKVLKHYHVISYAEIMEYHDKWVAEGFEGAMARTTVGMYEFGKRSNELWKFKVFEDAEFKILDIVEKKRPEDMCFLMELEDGETFECDIIGGNDVVNQYREDFDNIKGKMGTVKFFGWTMYGKPNIAKFKCVRDE